MRHRSRIHEALLVAVDHYLGAFHDALIEHAVGSVDVRSGVSSGESDRVARSRPCPADPVVLLRGLTGRGHADGVASLAWTGDADQVRQYLNAYG